MPEDNQETAKSQGEDNNSDIDKGNNNLEDLIQQFLFTLLKPVAKYIPISVIGGSSGFAVMLLKEGKPLLAFLLVVIAILVGIFGRYLEAFITALAEKYAERGKQDGNSVLVWIDEKDKKIREAIKWKFSGGEDKYLNCLKITDDSLFSLTEGLEKKQTSLSLADVFIELKITGQNIPTPVGFNYDDEDLKELPERDIWSLLKEAKKNHAFHSLMITAKGGLGKTTLLKHITHIYANKKYRSYNAPNLIPILLYLRRWQSQISQETSLDLATLIEQNYIPDLPLGKNLKLSPNWAKNHLNNGEMLIMLDGFDEVKKDFRQSVSQWIAQQLKNYPFSYFILTSRPYAVKDYQGKTKPKTRLSIIPFNDAQKARFIQRWYECREKINHNKNSLNPREIIAKATLKANNLIEQIKQRQELNQLARNPLMLNMIVSLHSLSQSRKLPNKRSNLYQQVISLQLGSSPLAKDIELILGDNQSENILQGLALDMMLKEQRKIDYEDLINKINTQFNIYKIDSSVTTKEFLEEIETISELIVKIDDYYEFAHLSFQEYLASKEIIKTKRENILIDNWDKSWWRETILLYSAQFIPTNLLQHLIEIKSEESIKLAKLCLDEIPEKKLAKVKQSLNFSDVIEEIENQVDNLLFQKLKDYLKNGQWQKADEETTRLMLQLGDKDEKGYLSVEDCQNFPKEELRTIDKLWLDNSDGKFGFSVQKQIYLEEGGKLNYYDYESYKKMGDRLGWRKNNKWLSYSNLTFDKDIAQQGQFPCEYRNWIVIGVKGHITKEDGMSVFFLFSRL